MPFSIIFWCQIWNSLLLAYYTGMKITAKSFASVCGKKIFFFGRSLLQHNFIVELNVDEALFNYFYCQIWIFFLQHVRLIHNIENYGKKFLSAFRKKYLFWQILLQHNFIIELNFDETFFNYFYCQIWNILSFFLQHVRLIHNMENNSKRFFFKFSLGKNTCLLFTNSAATQFHD